MKLSERIDRHPWFIKTRWLLVLPCAIGGLIAAILLSLSLYVVMEKMVLAEMCADKWAEAIPPLLGIGIAPVLIVYLGTMMAPAHRRVTAWILYGIGLCFALWMGHEHALNMVALVAVTGAAMTAVIHRRYRVESRELDGA